MKKILTLVAALLLANSCIPVDDAVDDGPVNPINESGNLADIAIFETESEKFPFIFQHKNGDRLVMRDINENGAYDGFIYKDDTYEELFVLDEDSGLPISKQNNEGLLVLYNFKENNSLVDVALVVNGEETFIRNISVPYTFEQFSKNSNLAKNTARNTAQDVKDAATAYEFAADIVSCVEGIGGFLLGTTLTAGTFTIPAGALAAAKCTPLSLTVAEGIAEASNTEIGNQFADVLSDINEFLDITTCPTGLLGCAAFLVQEAAEIQARFEEIEERLSELEEALEEALKKSAELVILGDLNFRDVELDDEKTLILDILNLGDEPITITSLEVNSNADQFRINSNLPIILGPAGSENFSTEISLTFAPNSAAGEYNTFLKINNDRYEPFDAKAISAIATNQDEAKIRFSGSVSFNGVSLDKPISAFFDIENPNLNDTLRVESIAFDFGDLSSDKFSISGWNSGSIEPGKKQEVEVVFEPTDETEYDGFIVINNNLDEVNNKWPVFGKGKDLEIRLVGDLNFGEVTIGETKTLSFDIENPNLNNDINVSDIIVPNGFRVDWTMGTIAPSLKQPVNITFEPDAEQDYSGNIIIKSNLLNDTFIGVNASGIGDSEELLSGEWKMILEEEISGETILNEFFTFDTENFEIVFNDPNVTYVQNSYQTESGIDINLVLESQIDDACEAEDGETPFFSTQRLTITIDTQGVRFVPKLYLGEFTMNINMSPIVPCPEVYPPILSGKASLIKQ